jgi:hypothetical protein
VVIAQQSLENGVRGFVHACGLGFRFSGLVFRVIAQRSLEDGVRDFVEFMHAP